MLYFKRPIKKVLIRGVNWIGDTVITLPTIQGIRNLFPSAHLAVTLKPGLAALFRHCNFVDELIFYPEEKGCDLIKSEVKLVDVLREKQFDLAVILPRSVRSALVPFLARIPCRLGYTNLQRWYLLSHRLKETDEVISCHQVDYYYGLVRFLGGGDRRVLPSLTLSKEEEDWVDSFLEGQEVNDSHILIGINPGSTYGAAKCWPPQRYIELSKRLGRKVQTTLVLTGGRDNAALVDLVAQRVATPVVKAVGLDLLNLAALLKRCRLVISNDTGPMHIAAAVGTPVVALFGPTNIFTTAPLGSGNYIIRKDIYCSPCLKRTCPNDHRCMELITVDEVEQIVMDLLEEVFTAGNVVYTRKVH